EVGVVAVVALEPPHEARAAVGEGVDLVEASHEVGHRRRGHGRDGRAPRRLVHGRDGPADVELRDLPGAGHTRQPADASTTSGIPDGSPAPAQRASDSRANSWSTTIDDAPITPARPPS